MKHGPQSYCRSKSTEWLGHSTAVPQARTSWGFAALSHQPPWTCPVSRLQVGLALTVLALAALPAAAQDTVTVSTGDGGGYAKYSGRILDYNGQRLQMIVDGDTARSFPAEKVRLPDWV